MFIERERSFFSDEDYISKKEILDIFVSYLKVLMKQKGISFGKNEIRMEDIVNYSKDRSKEFQKEKEESRNELLKKGYDFLEALVTKSWQDFIKKDIEEIPGSQEDLEEVDSELTELFKAKKLHPHFFHDLPSYGELVVEAIEKASKELLKEDREKEAQKSKQR